MKIRARLVAAVLAMGFLPASAQISDPPKVGEIPAPLQLTKIIEGPALKDATWESLKGKLVVLEFWNTQCVPCIQAIPHLNEMAEHFKNQPVVFLLISDDSEDRLKAFLKQHPIRAWLALDGPANATEHAFRLSGYGLVVLIDPEGKVAGFTLPALLEQKHLDRILAGQSAGLPVLKFSSPTNSTSLAISNSTSDGQLK